MGIYVDDNLNAGNFAFENMTAKRLNHFDAKRRVYEDCEFFECNITTTGPGSCFPSS